MKPFSDNIIFYNTEFTSPNPYEGEILSIGLVKLNGEKFYLELECDAEPSEWVKENIIPTLKGPKVSREEAGKQITEFVGSGKPYMVAFVNSFDAIYTYKLMGIDGHPFNWIPIDFASMLFAEGIDPNFSYKELGIDTSKYHMHNALDDAKVLREVYLKLTEL